MTLCFVLGIFLFFFSSRRRHTRCSRDWSSDVCSSDLLLEAWQEAVSVPSIQQVLEENGLGEPTPRGVGGAGVQAELFAREPEPQLVLPLEGCAAQFREPVSTGSEPLHIPERQRTVNSNAGGEEVGAAELGRGWQ